MLTERLFARLRPELQYLGQLEPSTRLAETLHRSLRSLRLAGISPTDVRPSCFEATTKGDDIARLFEAYERRLEELGLADAALVLRLAVNRLQNDPRSLAEETLVLIPEGLESLPLERRLVEALGKRTLTLPVENPTAGGARRFVDSDLELLQYFRSPADAPPPTGDGCVQFFTATGEINEVREVLRRAAREGIALDQLELLHTDSETYVPLVYETLLSLRADDEKGDLQPPVTFAEGLPCRYSRPGRALAAWIGWLREDFPQSVLVEMLRDGLLDPGEALESPSQLEEDDGPGASRLSSLLRSLGIGFGRARYLERIQEKIEALEHRARGEEPPRFEDEDTPEEKASTEPLLERAEGLRRLESVVSRLLGTTPQATARPLEVLQKAELFLEHSARAMGKVDEYARQRLVEEIRDMARWIALEADETQFDALDWLSTLPAQSEILGSGPKPGCLHVAHVLSGGHTGRPQTFLVGLDDSRFPRGGLQDPLILDSEKKSLGGQIATGADRRGRDLEALARLLGQLRGRVTLSFSKLSLTDDEEKFPSPTLLSLYRLVSGKRDADPSVLLQEMARETASFAPFEPDRALDATECWLSLLCGSAEIENRASLLELRFPHLHRGRLAAKARLDPGRITEFDGSVPEAGADLDPTASTAGPISASRLETAGECPLKFFFKYGLRIQKPEDIDVDPDQWLDALTQGRLLHLVFEDFMRELASKGQVPIHARDRERLLEILSQRGKELLKHYPPPNDAAHERQLRELRKTAETFLVEEEDYVRSRMARPVHLEASIGLKQEGHASLMDSAEPMDFPLSGGRRIRVRGRIDRIDLLGDPASQTYAIWDYKTGGTRKYAEEKSSSKGRVLQPALYVSMVEKRLKTQVSAQARVASFGFFFPGTRANGERIEWTPTELEAQRASVESLCEIVKSGRFLPTTDNNLCRHCDYREICGDVELLTQASKAKLERVAKAANPEEEPTGRKGVKR